MSSFKQDFEKDVNNNMQEGSSSHRESQDMEDYEKGLKKKDKSKALESPQSETQDYEFSEKKHLPPRFSTIFGPPEPAPTPDPTPRHLDHSSRRDRQRRGMFWALVVSVSLNVIMALMLFTIFFIGFYLNAQSRLMPWAAPNSARLAACDCSDSHPAINVAPKFIMPQAAEAVTVTVLRGGAIPDTLTTMVMSATSTTSLSSSSSSATPSSVSSVSSTNTSSPTAAAVTGILGVLGGLGKPSASTSATPNPGVATSVQLVTVGPTQSTVSSVQVVTVDPSGSPIADSRPTVTSTHFIDPTDSAKPSTSTVAHKRAADQAVLPDAAAMYPAPEAHSNGGVAALLWDLIEI